MEKGQAPGKRFRKAMFGFRKADVMNYIDWLEADMSAQLSAAQQELAAAQEQCRSLEEGNRRLESEHAIVSAERDRLVAQAVEAAERIDFLEASRLACTQRLSASERRCAELSQALSEEQTRTATEAAARAEAEEQAAQSQQSAEQLRLELAQQRVTLRAQTEACLELLAEVQEMADELQELGRDRVEEATGQSVACLTGIEEAMCALLDRISAWQNEIADIRILMENGEDGTAEAFTARLAVMRERAHELQSGAISRLRAAAQADGEAPAAEPEAPVAQAVQEPSAREPRRTAYTVRTDRAERRSRLLRLLEGWLGER